MKISDQIILIFAKFINKLEEKLDLKRAKRNSYRKPYDIIWMNAANQSAKFIEERLTKCMLFRSSQEMWTYTISLLKDQDNRNVVLEFGVAGGSSINFLSRSLPTHTFFGFDSFLGLPIEWKGHHAQKEGYSQKGILPKVNKNVRLIPGLFEDTLPSFLSENPNLVDSIGLLHIDSDIYSSCDFVLRNLRNQLKINTYILFDEHHGYPNWENGEFKALNNSLTESVDFEYVAFSNDQALIRLK